MKNDATLEMRDRSASGCAWWYASRPEMYASITSAYFSASDQLLAFNMSWPLKAAYYSKRDSLTGFLEVDGKVWTSTEWDARYTNTNTNTNTPTGSAATTAATDADSKDNKDKDKDKMNGDNDTFLKNEDNVEVEVTAR